MKIKLSRQYHREDDDLFEAAHTAYGSYEYQSKTYGIIRTWSPGLTQLDRFDHYVWTATTPETILWLSVNLPPHAELLE